MPRKKSEGGKGLAEAQPHYLGHRDRLRQRFREAGADALSDYEILEILLFRALPQRDVKPLAKTLIETFGSFAEVIGAPESRLARIKGLGPSSITDLKIIQAAASRSLRGEVKKRPVLSSWSNRKFALTTDPALARGDWGGLSQGRRLLRAVRTRTPRPWPLHNVREALAQSHAEDAARSLDPS